MEIEWMMKVSEKQWILQDGNTVRLECKARMVFEKLVRENEEDQVQVLFLRLLTILDL